MDFLDETRMTRWASICLFYNILLILLALANVVIIPTKWNIPLLIVLLLQLLFLGMFTFQPRSGSLQLFRYRLRINFLGQWMLPTVVCSLSLLCIAVIIGMLLLGRKDNDTLDISMDFALIILHFFHLVNLIWGFVYYLRTPRARLYNPTLAQDARSTPLLLKNGVANIPSGHLSKAYTASRKSGGSVERDRERCNATHFPTQNSGGLSDIHSESNSSPITTQVCPNPLKFVLYLSGTVKLSYNSTCCAIC
jgi:hypothetical protein